MTHEINNESKMITITFKSSEASKANFLKKRFSIAKAYAGYTIVMDEQKSNRKHIDTTARMWQNMAKQVANMPEKDDFVHCYYNECEIGKYSTRYYHLNEDGTREYYKG